jgi:hypothetical protein
MNQPTYGDCLIIQFDSEKQQFHCKVIADRRSGKVRRSEMDRRSGKDRRKGNENISDS